MINYKKLLIAFPDNFRRNNLTNVLSKDGLGAIIVTDSIDQNISCINDYAPVHVFIKVDKIIENYVVQNIDNAGDYTPFTAEIIVSEPLQFYQLMHMLKICQVI